MKIRTLLMCLWYLLLNCQMVSAKENLLNGVHVSGQVVDSVNATPLSYAAITLKGKRITTLTNDNGYFEIDIPADTCTIVATYVGFRNKEIKLNPKLVNEKLIINLINENKEIDEVRIFTEKEKIARMSPTEISAVNISPKLITKLPNMGEVDVMRSFQLLPGISGSNESSSGLYVFGGTPDQNLILFDGMTIYHVDHFFGFFSAFNANTIDDIELLKGGFPALYGGRLSSVMVITGKPGDLNNIHAGGGISLLSANIYGETPIVKNKLSIQFAARRSYSDIIQTSLYNKIFDLYDQTTTTAIPASTTSTAGSGSGSRFGGGGGGFRGGGRSFQQQSVTPTFHFYDLNSKLTYKPSEKDEIFFSFYNGEDLLDQSQSSVSSGFTRNGSSGSLTNITNWGNTGVSGQWKRKWNEDFNSHIFLSYSSYFNLTDRELNTSSAGTTTTTYTNASQAFDNANVSNKINDITFRFKNDWKISAGNQLGFGTEITNNKINYTGQRTDTLTVNGNANIFAGYLQDNIDITKKFHLLVGYRGDYFQGTSKFYNEPRVSLIYNISDNISLKGAYGKYYQFVSCVTQEDILMGNSQYWLLDNSSNVPVSYSTHYITGISYENSNFLFNAEGYYKDLTNVLEETSRNTQNFSASDNITAIYSGTGIAKGVDFMLQKKYGNTTGWISYTLGSVIYNFPALNYAQSFYADQRPNP